MIKQQRLATIGPPRQQSVDGEASKTATPYWRWARLLGRVFDRGMATGLPRKLASVPPPIAPARRRQELFAFDEAHASVSP
jgi:hypothetical protein